MPEPTTDPNDGFKDFNEKYGPTLLWAQAVDRANKILRDEDHVIIGQLTEMEQKLLAHAADSIRLAVVTERQGHADEAKRYTDAGNLAADELDMQLVGRLALPIGTHPACFPFDHKRIYMPRRDALTIGISYTEREVIADVPEVSYLSPVAL